MNFSLQSLREVCGEALLVRILLVHCRFFFSSFFLILLVRALRVPGYLGIYLIPPSQFRS